MLCFTITCLLIFLFIIPSAGHYSKAVKESHHGFVPDSVLNFPHLSVPLPADAGPAGAGWPGQGTRFLHTSRSFHRFYYPTRFVHDTVIARLTPEDIKKAREVKQAQVKPVRQKVG